MIGNYDLSYYVKRDLYKKLGGHYTRGSNDNMDLVCYSSYYYRKKLYNYIYFGKGKNKIPFQHEIKKDFIPIGDYLKFVKKNFFTKYYVLNLWGHGYGWENTLPFYNQNKNTIKNIELYELKYALSQNKFDILVYETCCGMNLENIYELKNRVKYICGNCDYTGYEGINHKKMIKCRDTPQNFCRAIVDNMDKELCPSFIKTNKLIYIKKQINIISNFLLKNHNFLLEIKNNLAKNIVDNVYVDLGYILNYIIQNSKYRNLICQCKILYKYLRKNIYSVPKKKFKINKCCGISIYFPRQKTEYLLMREKYMMLDFNKNNKWIKILDFIHKI
jgi:hypothetical protein